jgi:uncharacterized protein YciI
MRFLVLIDYTDLEARARTLESHRAYLGAGRESGQVVDSGPFLDGAGGMYVLEEPNDSAAQRFVASDPYFKDAHLGFTIRAFRSSREKDDQKA